MLEQVFWLPNYFSIKISKYKYKANYLSVARNSSIMPFFKLFANEIMIEGLMGFIVLNLFL